MFSAYSITQSDAFSAKYLGSFKLVFQIRNNFSENERAILMEQQKKAISLILMVLNVHWWCLCVFFFQPRACFRWNYLLIFKWALNMNDMRSRKTFRSTSFKNQNTIYQTGVTIGASYRIIFFSSHLVLSVLQTWPLFFSLLLFLGGAPSLDSWFCIFVY